MESILFFDTETQGLPKGDFKPHLVQLAAIKVNAKSRKITHQIDLIVRADDWEIDKKASDVHGITTEHSREVGISEKMVFMMFYHLWRGCKTVAHNSQFDQKIMRFCAERFDPSDKFISEWDAGDHYCTMEVAKPIMKLPNSAKAIRAGYKIKPPKLDEALKYFTGQELIGAHSALPDAIACMDLYWALQDLENE